MPSTPGTNEGRTVIASAPLSSPLRPRPLYLACLLGLASLLAQGAAASAQEKLPRPLVTGLKDPAAVTVWDGKVFVSVAGEGGKGGTGAVVQVREGKAVPFATGLDDPKGMVGFQQWLFVADGQRVWRINAKGKAEVHVAAEAFPRRPHSLDGIDVDETGVLYVSDLGREGDAVYRIGPQKKVTVVANARRTPALKAPGGVTMDGMSFLLVVDSLGGELLRVRVADGNSTRVADGLGGAAGLAWDRYGRLFLSDRKGGKVFGIARPGDRPVLLSSGFQAPGKLCVDPTGKSLLVPDRKAGTVTAIPATIPGAEVDTTDLPLETAVAFPRIKWAGWDPEPASGKVVPFRPVLLTHAGDGSNRVFVGTQQGVVHVFPNDQKADRSQVFLDLRDRVAYNDNTNEEGFLGLTFHPQFKKNGEFFVFYTPKKPKLTNVVSRFRVRKDDPNRADPASEEELLRFTKPFWNHDGGTLCFGPDGFLYVTHGDGGAANDPYDNGQNLGSLLGKVLRLDIDRKDPGKNYAVPKDNPFVERQGARPEIWAYGLRNIWRMAFDRKTGVLWAADVGQNLYEEIDLITRGGNYGWNRREGLHPFGDKGVGPRPERLSPQAGPLIDPIWEYHHDIGKSITGGAVYRGTRLPELEGQYVYGDYVTSRIWALRYDEGKKRVTANRRIRDRGQPIYSFGEDEKGELYLLTQSVTGQGLYWFVRPGTKGP
jgi:glucose/arabinose dehydrogenase